MYILHSSYMAVGRLGAPPAPPSGLRSGFALVYYTMTLLLFVFFSFLFVTLVYYTRYCCYTIDYGYTIVYTRSTLLL